MTAAPVDFECPQGRFRLRRYPSRERETLQAWNNADRLILDAVAGLQSPAAPVLVVNDDNGALTVALSPCTLWSDSWLSVAAAKRNLERNARAGVSFRWSTEAPPRPGLVVLRVPKSLAFFEDQLGVLAERCTPGTPLLAAGLDKHLSPHTADTIEACFGPTERHRGRLKARLFTASRSDGLPNPVPFRVDYRLPSLPFPLTSGSNVFSPERIDRGTALLLPLLAGLKPVSNAIDLACGNGIIGLHLLQQERASAVLFSDESAMAIASARSNLPEEWRARADFVHGDGVQDLEAQADLVVLNPPFHIGHVVDEYPGRRLIRQAHGALRPGGQLLLVFNNHLRYHGLLRSLFVEVTELARDRRFTVLLARRA